MRILDDQIHILGVYSICNEEGESLTRYLDPMNTVETNNFCVENNLGCTVSTTAGGTH